MSTEPSSKNKCEIKDHEIRPLAEALLAFQMAKGLDAKKVDAWLTARNILTCFMEENEG